jgi:hypothetical protein
MDGSANPERRVCQWCDEAIELDEACDRFHMLPMHVECCFRSIMGSVAHIEGRCGCVIEGASETDPPDMSRREAAKAALAAWRAQGHELPRE